MLPIPIGVTHSEPHVGPRARERSQVMPLKFNQPGNCLKRPIDHRLSTHIYVVTCDYAVKNCFSHPNHNKCE